MRKYYCDICGREMLGPMQEADLRPWQQHM